MPRIERRSDLVLPWRPFVWRLCFSLSMAGLLVGLSLLGGMAGYHSLEGLPWIDAFLNAAMILSGMGPLAQPETTAGKIFSGLYALYSGFAVLIIVAIALGPVIHRMLHVFHADEADLNNDTN